MMLSDQEIDELEAGPELDALVARKVIGLDVRGITDCTSCGCGWFSVPFDGRVGQIASKRPVYLDHCVCNLRDEHDVELFDGHIAGCFEAVKEYSASKLAIWDVLDKVARRYEYELGYDVPRDELDQPNDESHYYCLLIPKERDGTNIDEWPMSAANDLKLAICRAALKAQSVDNANRGE